MLLSYRLSGTARPRESHATHLLLDTRHVRVDVLDDRGFDVESLGLGPRFPARRDLGALLLGSLDVTEDFVSLSRRDLHGRRAVGQLRSWDDKSSRARLTRGPNEVASSAGYEVQRLALSTSRQRISRRGPTHVPDRALLGLFDERLYDLVVNPRLYVD